MKYLHRINKILTVIVHQKSLQLACLTPDREFTDKKSGDAVSFLKDD